jgi:polyisoprenyl-phosphate glycosyltransferase
MTEQRIILKHTAIVTPCYNEGKSILTFLKTLEYNLLQVKEPFSIIVVDDCSQDDTSALLSSFSFSSSQLTLYVLRLNFNVGHQSAIYQGLLFAHELNVEWAVVMDSDGEDDPKAIPSIMQFQNYDIVEVRRGKRNESFSFKVLYGVYKMIFRFITGKNMNYGNYCMINKKIIERIVFTPFIHFPAYLLRQKASRAYLRFDRGKRIEGESKMGLYGLLMHSFKSFIEFGEDLLMLFLKTFVIIIVVLVVLLIDVLYQKLIVQTAILGWTSTLILGLFNIAILCIGFFVIGILLLNLIHQQNNKPQKIPHSISKSNSP